MADTADGVERKLTLWEAAKDLGWFPALLATVVGAPSLLTLLQMVREGFRLSAALQWIVEGYKVLTAEMAAWIEPMITPVISWISSLLGWKLVLHSHWQPLFLLAMVYVVAGARMGWREGRRFDAAFFGVAMGAFALVGAILAGLVPFTNTWWAQGFIAAVPMATIVVFGIAMVAFGAFANGQIDREIEELGFALVGGAAIVLLIFVTSAALSIVVSGVGIWTLAILVMFSGAYWLHHGLATVDRSSTGMGLTILGGFVAAGLILVADVLVKALG